MTYTPPPPPPIIYVQLPPPKRKRHILLHLTLTFLTCGLWLPAWLVFALLD